MSSTAARRERLDRLVQRVMLGQVVPFLGAGFSQGAPWEEPVGGARRPPLGAGAIARLLADDLLRRYYRESGDNGATARAPHRLLHDTARRTADRDAEPLLDVHGYLDGLPRTGDERPFRGEQGLRDRLLALKKKLRRSQREVRHSLRQVTSGNGPWPEVPPLGEIAELHSFVLNPAETVSLLELHRWAGYRPTAAHHYLAILIREGCITEVFETNYDVFVEQAVRETYGEPRKPPKEPLEPAPVIHDLATYRRHVSEPRQPRRRRALAKVVKLNGCASAYLGDPRNKANTIVLTEAQLQSWGTKHWARDLLHVVVRSKTLLFMGFGASDPIVRYHALEVMREFYLTPDDQPTQPSPQPSPQPLEPRPTWYQHPNAPFVAEFRESLTFYQHQILRAFYQAQYPSSLREFTPLDTVEQNAFTGQDGPWFTALTGAAGGGAEKLPADLLLSVVATETVCRLAAERYLSRQGAVQAYLQGALRFPSSMLSLVRRAFLESPHPDLQPALARWMHVQSPPGKGDGVAPPQVSSLWSRLCFALIGARPGRAGYRSFEDAPIELPMLLVVLYLVRLVSGREPVPTVVELERMLVSDHLVCLLEPQSKHGYPAVYVSRSVDSALRQDTQIRDQSVLIALTRGSLHPYVHPVWTTSEEPDEDGVRTRSLRHVYVISDLDALRDGKALPVDLGQAQRNLLRAIRKPDRFIQRSRGWRDYCEEANL